MRSSPQHPRRSNKSGRTVSIIGTGSYVPERILTNRDLEKIVETTDEWIRSRTGIGERRIAAPEEATSDLATNAALAAMSQAEVSAEQIDLIIVATVTPDMLFPATACWVQKKLGAIRAACFDVSAACSGFHRWGSLCALPGRRCCRSGSRHYGRDWASASCSWWPPI